jgi:guanylate kinase
VAGLLVFISGPSGVGKSTVCRRLAQELPAEFAVSSTTRQGKPQDAFGKKYMFVDEPRFRSQLEAGEFLEYALVYGFWYGTLRKPVEEALASGKTVLLEIDVQGAIQVHKMFPDKSFGAFILPPDEGTLLQRLRARGRDDEATILRRFTEAQQEIRSAEASGAYDVMVVNADNGLDHAIDGIRKAVRRRLGRDEPKLF